MPADTPAALAALDPNALPTVEEFKALLRDLIYAYAKAAPHPVGSGPEAITAGEACCRAQVRVVDAYANTRRALLAAARQGAETELFVKCPDCEGKGRIVYDDSDANDVQTRYCERCSEWGFIPYAAQPEEVSR